MLYLEVYCKKKKPRETFSRRSNRESTFVLLPVISTLQPATLTHHMTIYFASTSGF